MVKGYAGDGVKVRQLEKDLEAVKSIAKIQKNKAKRQEKDIEKLEGYLADYNRTLKENEKLMERISVLAREVDKQKADKERMRRTFHQDMLVLKQKEIAEMQYHNQRFLDKEDIISV